MGALDKLKILLEETLDKNRLAKKVASSLEKFDSNSQTIEIDNEKYPIISKDEPYKDILFRLGFIDYKDNTPYLNDDAREMYKQLIKDGNYDQSPTKNLLPLNPEEEKQTATFFHRL